MDNDKEFNSLRALKKKMVEENSKKYDDESGKRLTRIIETKFKTSFIGALSCFEETFGFLWGHNSNEELTEEQQFMKDLWEQTRTSVLNNGNNQIRGWKNEMEQYTIHWDRYQMTLPVKPIPKNRNIKEED